MIRKLPTAIYAVTLLVLSTTPLASSQTTSAKPAADTAPTPRPANANTWPEHTYYLKNTSQQNNTNEILTALRNALSPADKIFLVNNQNAIVLRADPDEIPLVEKLLNDLDRPMKNYRLTYAVTEMDGSKQIGMQHYAMIMTSGQQTSLKLGNKFPIVTGSSSTGGNSTPDTQFTYLDVGMNFDATLTEMGENAVLKSSVEQASVAPQTSDIQGIKEPIIRQVTLRGEAFLTPGKTLKLGSMDIPGSTRHLDVEVVMEQLP